LRDDDGARVAPVLLDFEPSDDSHVAVLLRRLADDVRVEQVRGNPSADHRDRMADFVQEDGMSEAQLFVATTFTEIYERVLVGPLFRPFAEQLVARLAPKPGDSLIDVACGTGIVARLARERLGPEARIVGVDVAPAMLAVARTVDQTIDWRQGNATSLPIDATEQFTVLTCHQGLQFVTEKPAAVREMRRVLAPAGRVAIATWSSLENLPGMLELNALVEQHVGRIVDSRHSCGDAHALNRLLVEAGFRDVHVGMLAHDVEFADGTLFARLNAMAAIGMSERGKGMSEAERGELASQISVESQDAVARATKNGMFVLPLTSLLATARV
jgi:ubiquinone/menaquinone biosynthesis C-methylase UbiE